MNLEPWKLEFKPGWSECFKKFDPATQQRILKKVEQMEKAIHHFAQQVSPPPPPMGL